MSGAQTKLATKPKHRFAVVKTDDPARADKAQAFAQTVVARRMRGALLDAGVPSLALIVHRELIPRIRGGVRVTTEQIQPNGNADADPVTFVRAEPSQEYAAAEGRVRHKLRQLEAQRGVPEVVSTLWHHFQAIGENRLLVPDRTLLPTEAIDLAASRLRDTHPRALRIAAYNTAAHKELVARAVGAEEQCEVLEHALRNAPVASGVAKFLGKPPPKMKSLAFTWAHDIQASLDDGGSLIQGLLDVGTMSVVYGDSNVGKTFWAADLATHVAMGWAWRARAVKAAPVVYVIAEVGRGFLNRIAAIKQHYGIAADAKFPLAVVRSPVDLMSEDCDVGALTSLIGEVAAAMGTDAGLS